MCNLHSSCCWSNRVRYLSLNFIVKTYIFLYICTDSDLFYHTKCIDNYASNDTVVFICFSLYKLLNNVSVFFTYKTIYILVLTGNVFFRWLVFGIQGYKYIANAVLDITHMNQWHFPYSLAEFVVVCFEYLIASAGPNILSWFSCCLCLSPWTDLPNTLWSSEPLHYWYSIKIQIEQNSHFVLIQMLIM